MQCTNEQTIGGKNIRYFCPCILQQENYNEERGKAKIKRKGLMRVHLKRMFFCFFFLQNTDIAGVKCL